MKLINCESGNIGFLGLTNDTSLHGPATTFYPSGRIKEFLYYDGGKIHGPTIKFSDSDECNLISKYSFRNGVAHGTFIRYYDFVENWVLGEYENGVILDSNFKYLEIKEEKNE